MKVTLLVIGKTKDLYLQEGVSDYVKRIQRYVPFQIITLPDIRSSKKADINQLKEMEAESVLMRIKPRDFVVLLDERGTSFTSVNFARYLQELEGRTGQITFIIGGAYGFADSVYQRANARISLSDMTFSHQMVRLIFLEQLYRAYTIQRGEPYHHK